MGKKLKGKDLLDIGFPNNKSIQTVFGHFNRYRKKKAKNDFWQQHHSLEGGYPTRVLVSNKKNCPRKSKNFKGKRQELKNDLRKQLE